MRSRSLAALAAVSVLIFAACGDDDEDAGGDTTGVVGAPAAAPTEPEAAAVETTAAGVETPAAGVETTAAGVETSAAGVETTAAGAAAAETTAAAAETTAAETTAVETSEVAAAAATTEAAAETTAAAAETTAAAAETTAAPEATLEGAAVAATTEAAAETTEAAAETTEAAAETSEAAATETTGAAAETTAAPESSAPGSAPGTSAPGSSVPAGEPGAITVGSADFSESQLIAQIYGQALEAAGFDVSYEMAIGSREVYFGALEQGEISIVPEYTGSLLSFLTAPDVPETETVDDQVAALDEVLPDGLEVLTPSTAEDKDTMVCTQEAVDEHGLTDLSSLFEVSAEITLGAPPEFEERSPYGIAGFLDLFDAEFGEFVPLSFTDVQAGLEGGELDCGNLLSTGPWVGTEGLVIIEDDLNIIPHEAVLPLVRSEVVTPELTAALDEVNAALDTETLAALDAQVEVDQLGADVVAAEFLQSLGGGAPATTGA
jgi:osmoprotectant transport system substrate-binding protein